MQRTFIALGGLVFSVFAFVSAWSYPAQPTYDPSPLALPAFVCAYGLISAGALAFYMKRTRDLLSPLPAALVLIFLYSIASALYVREFGRTLYGDRVSEFSVRMFYVCCLTGCIATCLGCVSAMRLSRGAVQPITVRRELTESDRRFLAAALVLGATTLVLFASAVIPRFNFLEVASYRDTALESRVDRLEHANAGIEEVLFIYIPVTSLLSAGVMLALHRGPWLWRLSGAAVVASYLAANTLAGARRFVVEALLTLCVYFHYRVRPIGWKAAAFGSAFLYVFVNVLAIARNSSDPVMMIELVQEHWSKVGASAIGIASSGELLTGLNLHRLIDGLASGETRYSYGYSVVQEALVFVPRPIYPSRPLPLSERFVEEFYPGVREAGGGFGLFVLQEGYWAAGVAGVFVSMFFWSYACERIYRRFRATAENAVDYFVYAAVYSALIVGVVRSGIMSSFKAALLACVPLAIIWALTRYLIPAPRLEANH